MVIKKTGKNISIIVRRFVPTNLPAVAVNHGKTKNLPRITKNKPNLMNLTECNLSPTAQNARTQKMSRQLSWANTPKKDAVNVYISFR